MWKLTQTRWESVMKQNIKSIIYLFKPYWKYGKSMIIIMK